MWAETVREKRWDGTRTVKLSAPFSLIDADVLFLSSTPLCWAWLLQNVNELWNKIKKKNCLTRWKMREEKEKKRDLAFSETPLIYEPHVRWRSNISRKLEQVKSSAFKLDQIFLSRSQAPEKNGSKDTNTLLFSLHPTLSISSDLLWAHLFLELDSTSEYYQLLVSKQELHVSHFWQESFLWQISGRRRQNKLDFMWNTSHHFSAILKKKKETTSPVLTS